MASGGLACASVYVFHQRAAEIFKILIISLSPSKIGINRWYRLTPFLECQGEIKKKERGGRTESIRGQCHKTIDIDVSIHFKQRKGQCLPCFMFYG